MLTRRTFAAMAASAAAMSAVGIGGRARAAEPLKIGAVNPYSGGMALYGDEVTRCYELAAKQLNAAKGGLLGRPVEIVRGNATSAQEGIAAVEQLVGRDGVEILMGTYASSISNAASEAALNYGKLYWETNAVASNLTERGLPNFIRAGLAADDFGRRSVEGALELVAKRLDKAPSEMSVWLEHEDSAYGTSIAEAQQRLLEEAGVTVGVGAHSYKSIDVTDSILRAKSAAPDLWISTGYVGDTNLLLRAARDQGFRPPAIMSVGVGDTAETLDALGAEYLEGVLLVSFPRADISESYGPGSDAFLELYKAEFGRDPVAPQGMAAFVGAKILFEAVEAAGSVEFEAVAEAARAMDRPFGSYETGYGAKFDETMQNTRAVPIIAQWQSGEVKAVFPPEAASSEVLNLPRA